MHARRCERQPLTSGWPRTRTIATSVAGVPARRINFRRGAAYRPSKSADEIDHLVLPRAGDFRKHRQRDDPPLVGMGVRELLRTMLEAAIGGKKRQRGRIIHRGLHAMGVEMLDQLVASRMADGIEVVDVGAVG